jgi:transposase
MGFVLHEDNYHKLDLLDCIPASLSSVCHHCKVNKTAALSGKKILRLLPYHCSLNPIEMVWKHVNGHVARNN